MKSEIMAMVLTASDSRKMGDDLSGSTLVGLLLGMGATVHERLIVADGAGSIVFDSGAPEEIGPEDRRVPPRTFASIRSGPVPGVVMYNPEGRVTSTRGSAAAGVPQMLRQALRESYEAAAAVPCP